MREEYRKIFEQSNDVEDLNISLSDMFNAQFAAVIGTAKHAHNTGQSELAGIRDVCMENVGEIVEEYVKRRQQIDMC